MKITKLRLKKLIKEELGDIAKKAIANKAARKPTKLEEADLSADVATYEIYMEKEGFADARAGRPPLPFQAILDDEGYEAYRRGYRSAGPNTTRSIPGDKNIMSRDPEDDGRAPLGQQQTAGHPYLDLGPLDRLKRAQEAGPLSRMKESKITKNTIKQLIKEEFKALNERYQLPPIPRGMAYPDQDGIYPMSDDDGFPVYQSYPENIYEIPKYKQFFDWLDSQKPQGPPQLPPEEYFDPDPQPEPSIRMKENQEEGAWERAMARIRRLSDQAKTGGTALATKAGREIKMYINQLKKDDMIDEPTWRKARRALYKDKTGDMAIRILVDAVGPGEVEGALGGGFDDDDITGPALNAVRGLRESKLTKSMLKQIIKKELSEL